MEFHDDDQIFDPEFLHNNFHEPLMEFEIEIADGFSIILTNEDYKKYFDPSQEPNYDEKKDIDIDTDSENDDDKTTTKTTNGEENTKTVPEKETNNDDKPGTSKDNTQETPQKSGKKRKPQKDENPETDSKKSKSHKKSKPSDKKNKKPEPSSDEDSSDDEEINKLNKAAEKIPTYKSIKSLVKHRYYKVLDLIDVETKQGRTIRLKLEDNDVSDKVSFESNLTAKRLKAKERQQKHRKNMTSEQKKKSNECTKQKMRKCRSSKDDKAKELERKRNREKRYLQRQLKKIGIKYDVTDKIDINQHNFNVYMKSLQWHQCPHCNRRVIQSCFSKFKCHKNCTLFGPDNDMDPLPVPPELLDLTFIEKQLIARVHCVISLYKFKKCQYKYKGQVINFSQDVQSVADHLPHLVEDLDNVVVVKLRNSIHSEDFVVRKQKVLNALIWLKQNNPYYSDITIDYQNLDTLPVDGNVFDKVNKMDQFEKDQSETDEENIDDNNDIVFSHVPDSLNTSVKKSFNNFLIWPSLGTTPINEFSSPGYISLCFPHLFPYGKADYTIARPYKVNLSDYIHHLMLYKDGRFSQDERFRYFMMNSHMRWTSLNLGNVYVKKNSIFSKMTMMQLKEHFQENPWIADQIMHFGSRIRTTKSYWNSRCSELLDMVHQLGTPTVFFTLSSADYHWPDLYRLLGYDVTSLSNAEKSNLISQNPLIADTFFYLRSKFFLEKCFKQQFDVTDIWYRYEFQHRGSIHLHGLAWLKDAPSIKDSMTPDEEKTVINYFDKLISCENPDVNILPVTPHPCQLDLHDIDDLDLDLSQLINHVQRHTKCSRAHCLRQVGNTKSLKCRYKFPKELLSETTIEKQDGKIVDINFKRNDPILNKYNKWVLQTWRSNIDFSPILNKEIVYRYIAKYASKSEIKSICYNEVLSDILNRSTNDNDLSKKAIRKLLVTSCGERDYCAQEVMHYLMGYHLYSSSREFVVINLKSFDWSPVTSSRSSRNILDYYAKRQPMYEKLSLFQIAKYFKVHDGKLILRSRQAIVRFFPRFTKDKNEDMFYTYMSQIFYPWRSIDDLMVVDDSMKLIIDLSYNKYIKYSQFEKTDVENDDPIDANLPKPTEKDKEAILSSYNPNKNTEKNASQTTKDNDYQWDYMSNVISKETIQVLQEKIQTKLDKDISITLDLTTLNDDQMTVFLYVKNMTDEISQGNIIKSSFAIVQGMPGTGKTYLLKCCVQYISATLAKFQNTMKICSTNEATNDENNKKIRSLSQNIATIKAQNNNRTAFLSSDDAANGLTNVLSICKNAKVMLKKNINVSRGLVNGSIGIVKHIVYELGQKPPSIPMCVLVQFESVDLHDLQINYVPITPICNTWYRSGVLCSRIQLPIALCWACTIHKSQGLTLKFMVLDAGKSEFALGLLYVALSRVPDKESLCLVLALTLDRLNSVRKSKQFIVRRKFLRKLRKMSLI
ncbi:ATP-dependent DNA helicase [Frankliniella fusca]|uniref:ATP-dependent DNA helicase n=1 Tax=Frankliniella fusca TaxID=407009 RepID=A0AAE1GQL4_9NEOP|nr:ATP-dependent DNA helicase [Frankliniella fusca]